MAALLTKRPPEFSEALALCEQCPGSVSEAKIQAIRAHFGCVDLGCAVGCRVRHVRGRRYELFAAGDFKAAMNHMWLAGEPLRRVLGLFPMLIPSGVRLRCGPPPRSASTDCPIA